jgi:hypothetical protein
MSSTAGRGHHVAARLGVLGAALGAGAGIIQATMGSRIPDWTGAKESPGALGLLTVALAVLAGLAAVRQASPGISDGWRAACALGLLVPGLLCFTTVGRLWYVPGPLLLVGGTLCIRSWQSTASVIARNWARCLLSALGVCELLMAAGAAPAVMAVGAVGGLALITAAWLPTSPRSALLGLLAVGTVPFAATAWTAIAPILLVLATAAVATPLLHHPSNRFGVAP